MTSVDFILIYTGSTINVNQLIFELKQKNINPIIKNESNSARLAGFGITSNQDIKLYVHKDQVNKSKEIIKNLRI
tara:strand:+ start:315 stop:539 length:225 start_codon:yes stop_codon:yes gene_type:complete